MILMIVVWHSTFQMAIGIAKTVITLFHIYVSFLKPTARILLVLHVLKQRVPHVNHIVRCHALIVGYTTQKLDFVIR